MRAAAGPSPHTASPPGGGGRRRRRRRRRRPDMLRRIASALFGGDEEEPSRPEEEKEAAEEEEDWILVNYLAESCPDPCGSSLPGAADDPEDQDQDDDPVIVPSRSPSPPVRYVSCTSLTSTDETDPGDGAEGDGFLRAKRGSLEESWLITPPPCFTGQDCLPVLETSPLENLLIEHPSMSVYAFHPPRRLGLEPRPLDPRPLDPRPRPLDPDLRPDSSTATSRGRCEGVKKSRRSLDAPHRRPEAAVFQRHCGQNAARVAAACAGLLRPRGRGGAQAAPSLSRNALRRRNLLRPPKAGAMRLHQPGQRRLNC